jgi:ribonuclease E
VELPSGGYVIIEPTEALTVIDVNSGSFTRSANARETVLWTNCEAAVEIARQLKLRNIGGVVVIDFIDMESRRDQLQLLEHFTQSLRDDSARPQIAQLTELGLVELTRKRQGQNIYELFGRACPSCGGLGHVAVLPGRDTLQPLATLPGLVRTAAAVRSDAPPTAGEVGGSRRRRGGRGRGGELGEAAAAQGLEAPFAAPGLGATAAVSPDGLAPSVESASRRAEPELVAVPMDDEQELVYGWLGLSPALLLDPIPSGDAPIVRVVRPGTDADSVLEEARQQLAANGSRRRRRGRGGGEANGSGEGHGGNGELPPVPAPAAVTITPLPIKETLSQGELVTVAVPVHRRTRSRASAAADTGLASAADTPAATAIAVVEPPAAEDEGSGDRRRRRRSSASV